MCQSCIGRILAVYWPIYGQTVARNRSEQSPVIGPNSHQLRDKTVGRRDFGKRATRTTTSATFVTYARERQFREIPSHFSGVLFSYKKSG